MFSTSTNPDEYCGQQRETLDCGERPSCVLNLIPTLIVGSHLAEMSLLETNEASGFHDDMPLASQAAFIIMSLMHE